MPLYVFSTVMRSPWAGGKGVEPDYYLTMGSDIYQLASLQAKMDEEGLNPQERNDWFAIMRRIPMEYLQDWYNRRRKNMSINYRLIDDARKGVFTYYSLGHDDNSVSTQSSLESKYLEMAGQGIPKTAFGSFPGADQLGLLLITRASNDFNNYHPKISVIYPLGGGEKTVPRYDGQEIGKTIASHVEAIGGTIVDNERPDLLLAVNTPLTTTTTESANFENFPIMLQSTKDFLTQIEKAVNLDIPVSIVDMAFSNGSDNTLVYGLYQDKMMYRLAAYNGWNTASNSVGYGLSQGVLSKYMTPAAHRDMLTTQYLDNWAYQANVRDYVSRMDQNSKPIPLRRCTLHGTRNCRAWQRHSSSATHRRTSASIRGPLTSPCLGSACSKSTSTSKRRRPYRLKPMCAGASITSVFRTWPITLPPPRLSSMRPKPSMKTAQ